MKNTKYLLKLCKGNFHLYWTTSQNEIMWFTLLFTSYLSSDKWRTFLPSWKIHLKINNNSYFPKVSCFLDFVIVFPMIWKNQKNWEPWLVDLWVYRHSKMQKKFASHFFCVCFWAAIMGLVITLIYHFSFF